MVGFEKPWRRWAGVGGCSGDDHVLEPVGEDGHAGFKALEWHLKAEEACVS